MVLVSEPLFTSGVLVKVTSYLRAAVLEAKAADVPVTLLGYKTNGRGASCAPVSYDWWIDAVKSAHCEGADWRTPQIGIDTALASEYENELKEAGVPSWLFHTKEGKFSMYIDAVEGKLAPSSYCEDSEVWELIKGVVTSQCADGEWTDRIQAAFARF